MGDALWMKLRAARRGASLTQAQMAKRLGITRSGYAFLETSKDSGRVTPNVNQIKLIADAVGVPFDVLLDNTSTVDDVIRAQLGDVPSPRLAPAAAPLDLFRAAVQFAMGARDRVAGFGPQLMLGPVPLAIDYMHGKTAAVLLQDPTIEQARDGLGRLLMAEQVVGRRLDKVMILFSRQDRDVSELADAAMSVLNVAIRVVSSAEQVAQILAK